MKTALFSVFKSLNYLVHLFRRGGNLQYVGDLDAGKNLEWWILKETSWAIITGSLGCSPSRHPVSTRFLTLNFFIQCCHLFLLYNNIILHLVKTSWIMKPEGILTSKQMHMLAKIFTTWSGGIHGKYSLHSSTFVHRGCRNLHKIKVPCSNFKVMELWCYDQK